MSKTILAGILQSRKKKLQFDDSEMQRMKAIEWATKQIEQAPDDEASRARNKPRYYRGQSDLSWYLK